MGNKKYYLCNIKNEQVLAEFYDKDDCEGFMFAMNDWHDHHDIENQGSYTIVEATSTIQASDILEVAAHAKNCKYAAVLIEAKRLDGDERIQFADKWFALMRFMNASKFWQAD